MTATVAGARLFQQFLDPVDGVVCLSAEANAYTIRTEVAPHHLRFPLLLDPQATLRQHVAACGYAPASSRFGPYCDNILGMNWQLPDGRVVRIGERVVKTTTGYDLLRFLLHSGERYGQPLDYVLRLRPACESLAVLNLQGDASALRAAVSNLLKSSWMLWLDAVDLVAEAPPATAAESTSAALNGQVRLRIAFSCLSLERPAYEQFLSSFAAAQRLTMQTAAETELPWDGLPDLQLKTTPDAVAQLTCELSRQFGLRCVGLCASGAVLCYVPDTPDRATVLQSVIRRYAAELQSAGGDWHSRHLPPEPPGPTEAAWLNTFVREAQIQ